MIKDQKYYIAQVHAANHGAEMQMQNCLDSTLQ